MIELSSTRPTTSSGQTAPAAKLTINGWPGGDTRSVRRLPTAHAAQVTANQPSRYITISVMSMRTRICGTEKSRNHRLVPINLS
jgi:hypothetical protein